MTSAVSAILGSVLAAVVTGSVSIFLWWKANKSPQSVRRVKDVWQATAQQLMAAKDVQFEKQATQYERRISWLEAQLENCQRDASTRADADRAEARRTRNRSREHGAHDE